MIKHGNNGSSKMKLIPKNLISSYLAVMDKTKTKQIPNMQMKL